jgi:hypothetical protein
MLTARCLNLAPGDTSAKQAIAAFKKALEVRLGSRPRGLATTQNNPGTALQVLVNVRTTRNC